MSQKALFIIPIIYFSIVSIFLIRNGIFFSPDQFFAAALLITLVLGRTKQFIRDWSVPIVLFLSYDYLRGLTPYLNKTVNIYPMINFDEALFGGIPTNILQNFLFSDRAVHWYDYLGTVIYMSHFIVPLLVAFIFWLKNKKDFQNYSLALLLLSYAAFITYIVFPAMPPWMAAQQGIIPEVYKVMDKVFVNLPRSVDLPTVYKFVGANLVAAVPSLHSAYPLLTFLFIRKRFNKLGLLFLPYVFSVWFYIVYLGEHYVFDIVVGVLYTVIVYYLVMNGHRIYRKSISYIKYIQPSVIFSKND